MGMTAFAAAFDTAFRAVRFGGSFSPASLFSGGEQGGWYDFSDMSTLFQDSAGSTPVTAVEQPIGLALDKSKGLALGAELLSGWQNGSTFGYTSFTPSGTGYAGSVTPAAIAGAASSASISVTAGRMYRVTLAVSASSRVHQVSFAGDATGAGGSSSNVVTFPAGPSATAVYLVPTVTGNVFLQINNSGSFVSNITIDSASCRQISGNHLIQATAAARPVWSARKNLLLATTTLSTQSVTVAAGQMTLSHTGTGTITLTGASTAGPLVGAGSLTFTPSAGSLTLTVSGTVSNAQLEYAATPTRYQRVTTSTDYDTAGFPHFARYDGVDDSLNSAATVDFTATDKLGVFYGATTFSAAPQIINELSASVVASSGSFYSVCGPDGNFDTHLSRGTAAISSGQAASFGAAIDLGLPRVISATHDISGDLSTAERNGVSGSNGTLDKGAGNFGNYTFYSGARAAVSTFFNGQINQLITLGRTPTALEITNTEAYITAKTVNV